LFPSAILTSVTTCSGLNLGLHIPDLRQLLDLVVDLYGLLDELGFKNQASIATLLKLTLDPAARELAIRGYLALGAGCSPRQSGLVLRTD
jgi:hypothetical protein